jgi:hypothetical protein
VTQQQGKKPATCLKLSHYNPDNPILSFASSVHKLDELDFTLEALLFYSECQNEKEWVQVVKEQMASFDNEEWMKQVMSTIKKQIRRPLPHSGTSSASGSFSIPKEDSVYMSMARDTLRRKQGGSSSSLSAIQDLQDSSSSKSSMAMLETTGKGSGSSQERLATMKQGRDTDRQKRRVSASKREKQSKNSSPSASRSPMNPSSSRSSPVDSQSSSGANTPPGGGRFKQQQPKHSADPVYKNSERRASVEDAAPSLNRNMQFDDIQAALRYASYAERGKLLFATQDSFGDTDTLRNMDPVARKHYRDALKEQEDKANLQELPRESSLPLEMKDSGTPLGPSVKTVVVKPPRQL